MANMSYCRFQNTLSDLEDCHDHIDDPVASSNEQKARQRLIELCKDIAAEFKHDREQEED